MGQNIQQTMSKKGRGWLATTATISGGALLILLGLALTPGAATAQEESDPQQPSWQQRPVRQAAYYRSSNAYAGSPRVTQSPAQAMMQQTANGQRYRYARQPSTRPVSQAVLAESVAEGAPQAAPEEIYPQATPEAGNYGASGESGDYGAVDPPMVEDGAYCDSCGGNCDGSCGGYGEACGYGGPCWGGDCYGGPCWPWLGMEEGRLWARMEYLLWWTEGAHVPALVTSSTTANVSRENAGRLGLLGSTTTMLFGDEDINQGTRSGGRISFGLRPTECTPWGVEASYFQLETAKTAFDAESTGWPILALPYYDLPNDTDRSVIIAYPETDDEIATEGHINLHAATRFKGLEVLFRRQAYNWGVGNLDFLAGWRYNRMDDHLVIDSFITSDQDLPEGAVEEVLDRFDTKNIFNGGELGFVAQSQYCRWSFEGLMKVAFGSTRSEVSLAGLTTTSYQGQVNSLRGGLLVQDSNDGVRERTKFSMIPEFGVTVGYDLTCRLRATFGYTVIYWGDVARAADQVNLDVNRTTAGLARPSHPFVSNDFWAQGMNFGMEYRF